MRGLVRSGGGTHGAWRWSCIIKILVLLMMILFTNADAIAYDFRVYTCSTTDDEDHPGRMICACQWLKYVSANGTCGGTVFNWPGEAGSTSSAGACAGAPGGLTGNQFANGSNCYGQPGHRLIDVCASEFADGVLADSSVYGASTCEAREVKNFIEEVLPPDVCDLDYFSVIAGSDTYKCWSGDYTDCEGKDFVTVGIDYSDVDPEGDFWSDRCMVDELWNAMINNELSATATDTGLVTGYGPEGGSVIQNATTDIYYWKDGALISNANGATIVMDADGNYIYNGVQDDGTTIPYQEEACEDADGDTHDGYDVATCSEGDDFDDGDATRYPGAPELCDGKDNDGDGATDESVVTATINQSWVYPDKAGGNTVATVSVTLNNSAPSMCTISLRVEPVPNSGGHKHHSALRPHGKLGSSDRTTVNFGSGDTGPKTVMYTSSEVSGIEKIIAQAPGFDGKAEVEIAVKVPGLYPFYESYLLNLTGGDSRMPHHPDNHYCTTSTDTKAWFMARDFYKANKAKLGINDMSLEGGGLFDLCDTWDTKDTCALAKKGGHFSHKKGTSVDVDRCAESIVDPDIIDSDCIKLGYSKGYLRVDRIKIEKLCQQRGGRIIPESTIHCEFNY